jgi:nucleolar protein 15
MRAYFSQFGTITQLRLSRNKKSGASKHYAFIEFKSAEVAKIVAETMDNYLLFGHILKCKLVPPEQVHDDLWKGANKRYKVVPWNKIQGRKLKTPSSAEEWDLRIEQERQKRESKAQKLKELGYDFEVPELKTAAQYLETRSNGETPQQLLEANNALQDVPVISESGKAKKRSLQVAQVQASEPPVPVVSAPIASKVRKSRQSDKNDAIRSEELSAPEVPESKEVSRQEKEGKKGKSMKDTKVVELSNELKAKKSKKAHRKA